MIAAIIVASCLVGGIFIHSSCISKKESEKEAKGPHPFDKSEKKPGDDAALKLHWKAKFKHKR